AAALSEAEAQADAIFRSTGVGLDWKPAGEGLLTIVVLSDRMAQDMTTREEDLGLTPIPPRGVRRRRAYVFSGRGRTMAHTIHMNMARLLGCAIAHELGHLLLPNHSHTPFGVMRANWDARHLSLDGLGDMRFTRQQETQIREEVARLTRNARRPV